MLFGYLVVRALLILTRAYGRLPDRASAALARLLDAARTPFDVINYWGSRLGARITPASRMEARFDRVIAALERHLDQEPDSALREHGHGRFGPDIVIVFDGSRRLRSLPGAVGILREGPPAGVYRPAAPVAPVAGPRGR